MEDSSSFFFRNFKSGNIFPWFVELNFAVLAKTENNLFFKPMTWNRRQRGQPLIGKLWPRRKNSWFVFKQSFNTVAGPRFGLSTFSYRADQEKVDRIKKVSPAPVAHQDCFNMYLIFSERFSGKSRKSCHSAPQAVFPLVSFRSGSIG